MRSSAIRWLLLAVLLSMAPPALATTLWNEALDGDLSSDPSAPTPLVLGNGHNVIAGTVQRPADARDFVTFTLGPGQQLVALLALQWEDLDSGAGGDRGFHAINLGATSFIPSGTSIDSFLGGDHVDPLPAGTDVLPALAAAPLAGSGFTIPLEAGTYSYVIQQTGLERTGYTIDFVVTPEPSTGALLLLGAVAFLGVGVPGSRRRSHRALRRPSPIPREGCPRLNR